MAITLIFLVLLGLFLLFLELFIVPGVTFVGIAGIILLGFGIYYVYELYGALVGNISLLVTGALSVFVIVRSVKTRFWKRFSLDEQIDAKANELPVSIQLGETAVTLSRMRPSGTIKMHDFEVEAELIDGFAEPGTAVEIVSVDGMKILVKKLNPIV